MEIRCGDCGNVVESEIGYHEEDGTATSALYIIPCEFCTESVEEEFVDCGDCELIVDVKELKDDMESEVEKITYLIEDLQEDVGEMMDEVAKLTSNTEKMEDDIEDLNGWFNTLEKMFDKLENRLVMIEDKE